MRTCMKTMEAYSTEHGAEVCTIQEMRVELSYEHMRIVLPASGL